MQRSAIRALLTLAAMSALAFGAAACEPEDDASGGAGTNAMDDSSATRSGEPITYVATDHAFDGPDTLSVGWNTIRLRNEGQELHHLTMVKLDSGKTITDVEAYLASGRAEPPEWATDYGGPNGAIGPTEVTATIYLDEGDYVALCSIPSPDGVPHMAKGMVKAITVSGDGDGTPPVSDMKIDLQDFVFVRDQAYTAGKHVFEVTNSGGQPHEIVLVKLDEGKTAADFAAAFAPGAPPGPPPGMSMGGLSPMSVGQTAYFEADLSPGNYAALCFLPDPETGRPHFDLGMSEAFAVQ